MASRKQKVRAIWLIGQVILVVSYATECVVQYYVRIETKVYPNKYILVTNRIATLVTEFPINLAQLYYMIEFLKIKKRQRQLTPREIFMVTFVLSIVILNTLETLIFNVE